MKSVWLRILCCLFENNFVVQVSLQAGLRTLHEAGPELQRTISTDLEAMWAAEQMMEQEDRDVNTRRRDATLFGQISTEFKKHTSPLPRQKKLTSDMSELPIE